MQKDKQQLVDLSADVLGQLLDEIPWANKLVKAFRAGQFFRAERFIRGLDAIEKNGTAKDKQKLEEVLESKYGQQVLNEYLDTVLSSSSPTATYTLALFYADIDNQDFSEKTKRLICEGLRGIPEDLVEFFLAVYEHYHGKPTMDKEPYSVHFLRLSQLYSSPLKLSSFQELSIQAHALIRRGIFLPDYASGRLGGGERSVTIGIGELTCEFYRALKNGRQFGETLKQQSTALAG